ncbi:hypothetical protein [Thiocystis violacea]|uniref:hypothetical protein n=1 Tax=Thiocystis violacea TaxID=13725 RepID=UPI0019043D0F|nr:hypothetical protein [Thiocystis violacea]MBK1719157.1 hypothetical protein [Thiocystis violacea]
MAEMFETRYPNLAAWIHEHDGWIEIGRDEYSRSLIRILDLGGMVWEGEEKYASLDDALAAADRAIVENRP